MNRSVCLIALAISLSSIASLRAQRPDVQAALSRPIVGPAQSMADVQNYCEQRISSVPHFNTSAEWEKLADQMRAQVLENVVFRGEAKKWRDAKTKVEWLDSIEGGSGYNIRKLRYEALPGLWIPALLYLPDSMPAKTPAVLNVNGHDAN